MNQQWGDGSNQRMLGQISGQYEPSQDHDVRHILEGTIETFILHPHQRHHLAYQEDVSSSYRISHMHRRHRRYNMDFSQGRALLPNSLSTSGDFNRKLREDNQVSGEADLLSVDELTSIRVAAKFVIDSGILNPHEKQHMWEACARIDEAVKARGEASKAK
jgi:hypothetical protein